MRRPDNGGDAQLSCCVGCPKAPECALIIGAGPAGSTAAAVLAQAGITVTLVEQSRFPREKVCGECLSDLGVGALEAGALWPAVRALKPVRLERARFYAAGKELGVELPAAMWGVTRGALDSALLEAARAAGVHVLCPARAEQLPAGGRSAMLRDLETNRVAEVPADLLLLADGKSALLGAKPRATGDLGIKAHFEGIRADAGAVCLFGLRGHYLGLAPVSDSRRVIWNLAAAVPAAKMRALGGDHEALLASMRQENPALDRALEGASRIGPWLTCPLPRFAVRRKCPPGVIPAGNAAAALEPIGGEGMGLAIASALLAARHAIEGRTGARDIAELRHKYRHLWRRSLSWRALAMILSSPALARLGIGAAQIAPTLAGALTHLLRPVVEEAGDVVSRRRASVLS